MARREYKGIIDLGRFESPKIELSDEIKKEFDEAAKLGSGGEHLLNTRLREHKPFSPELSGGDIDAAWDETDTDDETVGGGNPTPDQNNVDEIVLALGIRFNDNEPLRPGDKIKSRDRYRWELNPASSEDYLERSRVLDGCLKGCVQQG